MSPIITTTKPLEKRREFDFYPTPYGLALEAMKLIKTYSPLADQILDPGAGTGVWGKAARSVYGIGPEITGVELRPVDKPIEYDRWVNSNFLPINWFDMPHTDPNSAKCLAADLIIGNPPYNLAEEFVRESITYLKREPGSAIWFLLRLAFLEGQGRARGLYKDYPLKTVHVLAARPSFMPPGSAKEGKTDATAYALFHWQPFAPKTPTIMSIFDWKK